MKNGILLALILWTCVPASGQSRWNMGIGLGGTTNMIKFESGDEIANALFRADPYHSAALNVNISYKLSEKFSIQSGYEFTEFGFNYTLGKDYSLKDEVCTKPDMSASTCISSIPTLFVMRTPKSCCNTRFVFGAGLTVRGIDEQWNAQQTDNVTISESGNAMTTQITETAQTVNSISGAFTWMLGMEKVLGRGNSLAFLFTGNQGFNTIAESTVRYTVDSKSYTHTFINRGSYVNFSIAYNFAPFGTRKAIRAANAAKTVLPAVN